MHTSTVCVSIGGRGWSQVKMGFPWDAQHLWGLFLAACGFETVGADGETSAVALVHGEALPPSGWYTTRFLNNVVAPLAQEEAGLRVAVEVEDEWDERILAFTFLLLGPPVAWKSDPGGRSLEE